MKKVILGIFCVLAVICLAGCVKSIGKDVENLPGKFFEIGKINYAWGSENLTVCNDGRVYQVPQNPGKASLLGSLSSSDIANLHRLIGTGSISYRESFDDPELFDDDHEVFLKYLGSGETQQISHDTYNEVAKVLEKSIKDFKRGEVVSVIRESGKENIVQWQDSETMSFKSYLSEGQSTGQPIYFKDLNPQQLEIIKRMYADYKKKESGISFAKYAVEEEAGVIYGVGIYNEFFSITTWPEVVYSIEEMTTLLGVEASKLFDLDHTNGSRLRVPIEKVTDPGILEEMRKGSFGTLWVVWMENGRKVGSKYQLSLAFGDQQVSLHEICK